MASTTPLMGITYPGPGDSADVSYWLQQQAQSVEANFAAWTAYTPVLTAATTNPTLGAGSSATGRFRRIGKTVTAVGQIQFGTSGVNAGSGQYNISLPVSASTASGGVLLGALGCNPNGGANWAACQPFLNVGGGGTAYFWGPTSATSSSLSAIGNGGALGTAFTTTGLIRWSFVYEAA